MSLGRFQRAIGLLVLGATGSAAALLWFAVAAADPETTSTPQSGTVFGSWQVFYDTQAPSRQAILVAAALAVLFAAGLALLERRIATRSRRSVNEQGSPLAPRVVMAATKDVFAGPVTVTVLIPAHNEEGSLAGVEVFESVGNIHKKAGALNQALRLVLPQQDENDVVMVMDADTVLDDDFLSSAVTRFTSDRALMAVGGLFHGEPGHGILGQFQRNEYIRYAREMRRRRGRVFVLTGTASLFRPRALRTVAASRSHSIPGSHGDVYDTAALTEDNELTIALKSLGALMVSPAECTVVTELMPTWATLGAQRLRWQRGALENLGAYGLTPQTFRYWAQQLGIGYGVIALSSYLLLIILTVLSLDHWIWFPFWVGIGALFALERVVTVWKGGPQARLLALTLFPELIFDMYLNIIFVKGILDIALGQEADWKHVTQPSKQRDLQAA